MASPGEQVQEVALARAVRADDRDALAEPDLDIERVGEPVELEPLEDDARLPVRRAAEPHADLLVLRRASGGGPASSKCRRRLSAAFALGAKLSANDSRDASSPS